MEFYKYLLVGGIAFCDDYATLIVLTSGLGVYYLVSAAIAFCVGITVNYVLSIRWVFGHRALSDPRAEFVLFTIVGIVGLGLTEVCMWLGTDVLHLDYKWSKLVAVALVLLWNFGAQVPLVPRGQAMSARQRDHHRRRAGRPDRRLRAARTAPTSCPSCWR